MSTASVGGAAASGTVLTTSSGRAYLDVVEQYRQAMAALSRAAVAAILSLWAEVDKDAMTWRRWPGEPAEYWVVPAYEVIEIFRSYAHQTTLNYLSRIRELEIGSQLPDDVVPELEKLPEVQLTKSLSFVGRGVEQEVMKRQGIPAATPRSEVPQVVLREAADRSQALIVGKTTRFVQEAARSTVVNVVKRDKRAVAWMRVTDADPCYFCAMLASRGAVYDTERVATFINGIRGDQYHDHCNCIAVPIYSHDAPMPDETLEYAQMWKTSTKGYSGRAARNAFRSAFEQAKRDRAQGA